MGSITCPRGSCVDCEEQDAVFIDSCGDELCSTCYSKRLKREKSNRGEDTKDTKG